MNSPASFVKPLLAQCCLGGICEWVVCPGARNVALLQVLAAAEDLVKWTHFDERSAAFFALGRIQDMGLPVAVVTTSGTAAAELLANAPALAERGYELADHRDEPYPSVTSITFARSPQTGTLS